MRAALLVAVACVLAIAAAAPHTDSHFQEFQSFTHKYNKMYTNLEEYMTRYSHFLSSLERLEKRKSAHLEAFGVPAPEGRFAVTKFSDMSAEEFKTMLGFRPSGKRQNVLEVSNPTIKAEDLPTSYDWRDHGAITPVKNQGQCGSCWAFSATEELESAYYLFSNNLVSLSPQQIVSCDTTDQGCNGGDTTTAYAYIEQAGGLESSTDYPYKSGSGRNGICTVDNSKFVATVTNWTYATPPCDGLCNNQNEDLLAQNLASVAPVSICLDAETWQDYGNGIITSDCPHAYSDMDHCVQLVGFNTEGSTPYWIVRNSWGADWGEAGYIYLEMGKNMCGVANEATIVTASNPQ